MINNKIRFTKIRNVKSPKRNYGDAGNDFFVPEYEEQFIKDLKEKNKENNIEITKDHIVVKAHSQVIIPCGIRVDIIDKRTYLKADNKSGIATNKHFLVGADVVDAIYQGEVHINVHNVSDKDQEIQYGTKLVQFIHQEYIDTDWEEISNEEYDKIPETDRGNKGFGKGTGLK